jgi:putative spermidine/putrescine transport system permease protein
MRRALLILFLLMPGLGLVVAVMGSVLYLAVMQSFGMFNFAGESTLSLEHWTKMFGERGFWRALQYSAYIATTSSLIAVALAYPLALLLRKPFKGSLLLNALVKTPLLIPGLVAAFLFLNVVAHHGIINAAMVGLGVWERPVRMQNDANGYGVIFLQVWKQMPFAFLLLTGAVRAIPDPVLLAARDLGAGSIARFRKIVVPMTTGAMQASLILIFIGAAGDFSFQAVVGPTSANSLATMMNSIQSDTGDWNGAAVVAVTLMALSLLGSSMLALAVQALQRASR